MEPLVGAVGIELKFKSIRPIAFNALQPPFFYNRYKRYKGPADLRFFEIFRQSTQRLLFRACSNSMSSI